MSSNVQLQMSIACNFQVLTRAITLTLLPTGLFKVVNECEEEENNEFMQ